MGVRNGAAANMVPLMRVSIVGGMTNMPLIATVERFVSRAPNIVRGAERNGPCDLAVAAQIARAAAISP